ncbi:hypothetical protein [Streptomyces sp. NPDC102462]|uniref:hypothetical protein n=1 Tax=Streptomyces sp. NPDC102462 TaxID=3366178 RepID=UPI0037FA564A
MTAGWCSRTVRAALFAAVCVLLAALGHVLMSGRHVPAGALAAGGVATGVVGWCLAGRERGPALIVTVVVAAQTALHSAFTLAQRASGDPGTLGVHSMGVNPIGVQPMGLTTMGAGSMGPDAMGTASVGRGPMDMGSMDMGEAPMVPHMGFGHMDVLHMAAGHMGLGPMDHLDHLGHPAGTSAFGMLLAHLLAAVLCGLWLAHGERAAFRVLRAVAARLAAPLRLLLTPPGTPDGPRVRVRRLRSVRAPRLLLLVHAITTRGPPTGTAVV